MNDPTGRFDTETDAVYAGTSTSDDPFRFDEAVARVFPDMIRRSVPGYTTIVPMIGIIAARFARPHTTLYDLGCSLGAVSLAMRHSVKAEGTRIVAVDNAASMIERCRHYVALDDGQLPVALQCADIRSIDYQPASVVALNFTLQFLPPQERDTLLHRLCQALAPGGVLVLSEKVAFEDPAEQSLLENLHLDFKRAQGYSEMEISRKRNALEQVLIPETIATHRQRLQHAGFEQVTLWHQSLNFVSMMAVAPEGTP
ncbi:carboxy-S-adenosyl-L-methionine synthase CmoA [Halomonadaceae bacterium KBTZ08]